MTQSILLMVLRQFSVGTVFTGAPDDLFLVDAVPYTNDMVTGDET